MSGTRGLVLRAVRLWVVVLGLGCSSSTKHADAGTTGASAEGGTGGNGSAGSAMLHGTGGATSDAAIGQGMTAEAARDARCGPVLHEPRCLHNGWCWDGPRPIGGDLKAIDGPVDANSIWAVGAYGSAFRYCEGVWLPIETGVDVTLYGVFHPRADFAVAVGEKGTAIVWNGKQWTPFQAPTDRTLRAVWGASTDEIWITGDETFEGSGDSVTYSELILRFDGTSFTTHKPVGTGFATDFYALAGRSASDIYAAGGELNAASLMHYDGKTWTKGFIDTRDGGEFLELMLDDDGTQFTRLDSTNTQQIFELNVDLSGESSYRHAANVSSELSALFRDRVGRPAVVEHEYDSAVPNHVLGFDGKNWSETPGAFETWPTKIWSTPSHAWAIAGGASLLRRGDDDRWSQTPEIASMPGQPVYVGGSSVRDLFYITDHDVFQRDASGWKHVDHVADLIWKAAVDLQGHPYIVVQPLLSASDSEVRYHDGTSWHSLPTARFPNALLADAPNDVWSGTSSPQHFDGTRWNELGDFCGQPLVSSQGKAFRRAPDGKVWLVGIDKAIEFDIANRTCTEYVSSDGFSTHNLADIAWSTQSGEPLALASNGQVYRIEGGKFMPHENLFPPTDTRVRVQQLFALPNGKFRVAIDRHDQTWTAQHFATIELTGGMAQLGPETDIAGEAYFYPIDEARTLAAVSGGVLRFGGPDP